MQQTEAKVPTVTTPDGMIPDTVGAIEISHQRQQQKAIPQQNCPEQNAKQDQRSARDRRMKEAVPGIDQRLKWHGCSTCANSQLEVKLRISRLIMQRSAQNSRSR